MKKDRRGIEEGLCRGERSLDRVPQSTQMLPCFLIETIERKGFQTCMRSLG